MILLAYLLALAGLCFLAAGIIRRHQSREFRKLLHIGFGLVGLSAVMIAVFLMLF